MSPPPLEGVAPPALITRLLVVTTPALLPEVASAKPLLPPPIMISPPWLNKFPLKEMPPLWLALVASDCKVILAAWVAAISLPLCVVMVALPPDWVLVCKKTMPGPLEM